MEPDPADLTGMLNRASAGAEPPADELFQTVYERLKQIASGRSGAGAGDALHTTQLVHEAYLKLFRGGGAPWNNRSHFFAVAASAMRQIAIDHARAALAEKRGGGWSRVAADDVEADSGPDAVDILALDEALKELASLNARQAAIVELRFFGGLRVEDVAAVLGASTRTIELDWRAARAWLRARLEGRG